jgi:hydroxymethylpyrimidine pyrophosphatase-like HAD family hydrolase
MRRVVFVDLDDTLFQTQRKNPHADRLAAVDREGNPLSFRCGRQEAFLDWLAEDAMVIPVTGRSVDAFRRVTLPLGERAICSFGGVILDADGNPEQEWHGRMAEAAAGTAGTMDFLLGAVSDAAATHRVDARHRIIRDAGLPLYISVKHNAGDATEMTRLASAVSPSVPEGWTLHINANNMALLPPFLGKAAAVAFFLERFAGEGAFLTVGVGDSLTDVGFMSLCDFVIAPSKSQIVSVLSSQTPLAASGMGEEA